MPRSKVYPVLLLVHLVRGRHARLDAAENQGEQRIMRLGIRRLRFFDHFP